MKRALQLGLVLAALGLTLVPVSAQYKWETPAGSTVYSDMPPPPRATPSVGGAALKAPATAGAAATDAAPGVQLPYELKTTSGKYPVVLYTAPDCPPCDSARKHLSARGIPYAERSISTSADLEAFKARALSESSFPALTVGREKSVGYEAGAYDRLLTVAGYPPASRLPAGYRQAAAEPLVAPALAAPEPQKVEEILQREAVPGSTAEPSDARSATERYREQVRGGSASRAPDTGPSMRF